MNTNKVQNQIIDIFFGETFKRHSRNVDMILSCTSLDKFLEIKNSLSEEDLDSLFQSCAARDMLSAKFNHRECKGTFLRLKTVSLSSDFV